MALLAVSPTPASAKRQPPGPCSEDNAECRAWEREANRANRRLNRQRTRLTNVRRRLDEARTATSDKVAYFAELARKASLGCEVFSESVDAAGTDTIAEGDGHVRYLTDGTIVEDGNTTKYMCIRRNRFYRGTREDTLHSLLMTSVARRGTGDTTASVPYSYEIRGHEDELHSITLSNDTSFYKTDFINFQQRGTNTIILDNLVSGGFEFTIDDGTLSQIRGSTISQESRRDVIRFFREFPAIFDE